jgi:hypothetical protein
MSNRDEGRTMLSMPRLGDAGHLADLVRAYGGEVRVCMDFRIAPELLRAYLDGVVEVPRTVMLAVYWQGPDGFRQAFVESHWTHQDTTFQLGQAKDWIGRLQSVLVKWAHCIDTADLNKLRNPPTIGVQPMRLVRGSEANDSQPAITLTRDSTSQPVGGITRGRYVRSTLR